MTSVPSAPDPTEPPDEVGDYYDKCLVHDPDDIRQLLQQLVDGRCLVKVHADGDDRSLLTAVLQVDATSLWLDQPPARDLAHAWLESARLHCDGSLDRIALRFACGPARAGTVDGHAALALPLPRRLLHMQRREFLRREPPLGALVCRVLSPQDGRSVLATIRDIGGGGLAVLASEEALPFASGDLFPSCVIELPQIGSVEVCLRVRHVITRRQRGQVVRQAGCEFVDISPAVQGKLFRYIMQLDRDALARRRQG